MHLISQLLVFSICLWLAATNPAGEKEKNPAGEKEKKKVKKFVVNKGYIEKHPDSILLKTPKFKKYNESHKELDSQIFVPVFKVIKQLKKVHASKFHSCPQKARDCKAKPEIQPRNVSEAWPQGERSNNYVITWSDCEITCCTFTEASWEDCIFEGFVNGDPGSTILVTGCLDEDQGVQIHSKKFGNHIFTTDVFTDEAMALVFDEDDFYYDYEDYEDYGDEFYFN
jgi:hypothetical protein